MAKQVKFFMKYKLILFDADGTIFDDDQAIVRAIKKGFIEKKLNAPSEHVILKHAGHSARQWIELIAKDEQLTLTNEELNEISQHAVQVLTGFFFKILGREMHGAKDVIHTLHTHHIKTTVVTNSTEDFTREALKIVKMDGLFQEVFAFDNGVKPKPAPDILLKAIHAYDIPKEHILMVGDTQVDIDAANAAGIDSALLVNHRNKDVKGVTQRITSLNQLITIATQQQ